MAASCYDLWYARNAIYDSEGYCFQTDLGMSTFDNSDCWTTNPHLTKWEQKQVAQIQYQEKIKHCHVNEDAVQMSIEGVWPSRPAPFAF